MQIARERFLLLFVALNLLSGVFVFCYFECLQGLWSVYIPLQVKLVGLSAQDLLCYMLQFHRLKY